MPEEVTELGFSVQATEAMTTLRGQYDGSRLSPAAKLAVSAMLSLPGVKVDTIAQALNCSWETVVAVREQCRGAIREFKEGLSAKLMSAVEIAMPSLLDDARKGKLTPFDLGVLIDKILLLTGEATSVVEHRHQITGSVGLYSQLNEALRIHSETEKNPALEPPAVQPIEAEFRLVESSAVGNSPPETPA